MPGALRGSVVEISETGGLIQNNRGRWAFSKSVDVLHVPDFINSYAVGSAVVFFTKNRIAADDKLGDSVAADITGCVDCMCLVSKLKEGYARAVKVEEKYAIGTFKDDTSQAVYFSAGRLSHMFHSYGDYDLRKVLLVGDSFWCEAMPQSANNKFKATKIILSSHPSYSHIGDAQSAQPVSQPSQIVSPNTVYSSYFTPLNPVLPALPQPVTPYPTFGAYPYVYPTSIMSTAFDSADGYSPFSSTIAPDEATSNNNNNQQLCVAGKEAASANELTNFDARHNINSAKRRRVCHTLLQYRKLKQNKSQETDNHSEMVDAPKKEIKTEEPPSSDCGMVDMSTEESGELSGNEYTRARVRKPLTRGAREVLRGQSARSKSPSSDREVRTGWRRLYNRFSLDSESKRGRNEDKGENRDKRSPATGSRYRGRNNSERRPSSNVKNNRNGQSNKGSTESSSGRDQRKRSPGTGNTASRMSHGKEEHQRTRDNKRSNTKEKDISPSGKDIIKQVESFLTSRAAISESADKPVIGGVIGVNNRESAQPNVKSSTRVLTGNKGEEGKKKEDGTQTDPLASIKLASMILGDHALIKIMVDRRPDILKICTDAAGLGS